MTDKQLASQTLKDIIWVDWDETLRVLCEQWRQLPFIAIDTEFMRTNTYYPLPALIQVFDGKANYLIDPTKIESFAPFTALLTDESVIKVLHACSEDLEVFIHLLGAAPSPVFDTQIAASFCGLGYSRGYAKLVEAILNIDLPKEETRSDWLQRPLTESQKHYAACDVEYLHSIYLILNETLVKQQKLDWALSESQRLVEQVQLMQNPELAFTKYKAAWRLKPRNLALLKQLALWRELTAQERNVPRSRVVDNKSVYTIAELMPNHISKLRSIDTLHESAIRRHGSDIINLIERIKSLEQSLLPPPLPRPPSTEAQKQIKRLREVVDAIAATLALAPELLATRKDLETLIQLDDELNDEHALPEHLTGWRAPILDQALNFFHGTAALQAIDNPQAEDK